MTRNQLQVAVGALLTVMGLLWAGQGMGFIGGSVMSGQLLWAVVGPIVALVGASMVVLGLRRPR